VGDKESNCAKGYQQKKRSVKTKDAMAQITSQLLTSIIAALKKLAGFVLDGGAKLETK
jgi:hypothetical protein